MAESSPQPPLEPPARERSPAKRFFLFSAGATSEVLDECPHSEERLMAGLGSLVVVTTLLAFSSMFVLAIVGLHLSAWAALPIAAAWAVVIYVIDRFLVSVPLNPHKFTPHMAGTSVVSVDPPLRSRMVTFVKTLLGAIPRLLLALAAGILIAEPLLLVAFNREVEERVTESARSLSARLADQARSHYEPLIEEYSVPQTPEAQELLDGEQRLSNLPREVEDASNRVGELRRARDAECSGQLVSYRHPTGDEVYTTTGNDTCGEAAANIQILIDRAESIHRTRLEEQARLQRRVQELRNGSAGGDENERIQLLSEMQSELADALENAREQGQEAGGLLMQIEALEALARDPEPFSSGVLSGEGSGQARTDTPLTPAAGTTFLGLTTLGVVVWLTRLFIVLLDTMAIFGKLFLSLRRRRPYDAVTAEHEERAVIEATKRHLRHVDDLNALREKTAVAGFRRRGRMRGYEEADSSDAADMRPHLRVTSDGRSRTYAPSQGDRIQLDGSPIDPPRCTPEHCDARNAI